MNKVHLEEKLIHLKAMNTGHETHLFQVVITFTSWQLYVGESVENKEVGLWSLVGKSVSRLSFNCKPEKLYLVRSFIGVFFPPTSQLSLII